MPPLYYSCVENKGPTRIKYIRLYYHNRIRAAVAGALRHKSWPKIMSGASQKVGCETRVHTIKHIRATEAAVIEPSGKYSV